MSKVEKHTEPEENQKPPSFAKVAKVVVLVLSGLLMIELIIQLGKADKELGERILLWLGIYGVAVGCIRLFGRKSWKLGLLEYVLFMLGFAAALCFLEMTAAGVLN